MHYQSLLNRKRIRLLAGIGAGILFKFPVDLILAVLYPKYSFIGTFSDYGITILASIGLFMLFFRIGKKLEKHFSWDQNPRKRFLIQFCIYLIISILIVFPTKYLFHFLAFPSYFYVLNFELLSLVVLFFSILAFNLADLGYFLIQKWRYSLAELERFKKENAEFRFETLMNQVNPHFLFNSLNTLSSLVYENPDTAAKYIRELSKVYRYVLINKENELVSLQSDLEFLKAYVYLLELRFSNMISFSFTIDESKLQCLLAPMTIQLLIENAVKHNVVSKKKNLEIRIFTENNHLIVANNLQKKAEKPYSSGLGLENIKSRYSYLTDKEVVITETESEFRVSVPLICTTKL